MILYIRLQNNIKGLEIIADSNINKFTRNNKLEKVDVEDFVYKVTNLIWNWPEHLENENPEDNDNNSYEIKIFENDKLHKKFTGVNSFPDNYDEFLKLVRRSKNNE